MVERGRGGANDDDGRSYDYFLIGDDVGTGGGYWWEVTFDSSREAIFLALLTVTVAVFCGRITPLFAPLLPLSLLLLFL